MRRACPRPRRARGRVAAGGFSFARPRRRPPRCASRARFGAGDAAARVAPQRAVAARDAPAFSAHDAGESESRRRIADFVAPSPPAPPARALSRLSMCRDRCANIAICIWRFCRAWSARICGSRPSFSAIACGESPILLSVATPSARCFRATRMIGGLGGGTRIARAIETLNTRYPSVCSRARGAVLIVSGRLRQRPAGGTRKANARVAAQGAAHRLAQSVFARARGAGVGAPRGLAAAAAHVDLLARAAAPAGFGRARIRNRALARFLTDGIDRTRRRPFARRREIVLRRHRGALARGDRGQSRGESDCRRRRRDFRIHRRRLRGRGGAARGGGGAGPKTPLASFASSPATRSSPPSTRTESNCTKADALRAARSICSSIRCIRRRCWRFFGSSPVAQDLAALAVCAGLRARLARGDNLPTAVGNRRRFRIAVGRDWRARFRRRGDARRGRFVGAQKTRWPAPPVTRRWWRAPPKRVFCAPRCWNPASPPRASAALHAPAGIHIHAIEPAEIAISILAEIVRWRRAAARVDS